MSIILVKLPPDRAYCGELSLIGMAGEILAGPFEVAGRANAAAAAQAGNPDRSPLLPYGDTPTGHYRLTGILRTGANTVFPARGYGGHGILVLSGKSGDAALAEANGRFHLFVQGGATHKDGRLTSTNGALRLRNADLAALIGAVNAQSQPIECWCVNDAAMPHHRAVYTENKYNEGDPPVMPEGLPAPSHPSSLSRRRLIGAGAAISSVVLLPGVFIGAETVFSQPALAAYGSSAY